MLADYDLKQLVLPLRDWFLKEARDLPWREDPTPYHVWISEIMLQQTRVEAVKPYYYRFLQELPDVLSLAQCPEDTCLKLWEGLGYYSRVRNLHAAAGQIVEQYGGELPRDYEALLQLKGIGRYTAGAIASLAYELPVPAVDGNVLRVLTRVCGDDTDIGKESFRHAVEAKLKELLETVCPDPVSPRIFNQALMELGALVCVPNGDPRCNACPLKEFCLARREGRTSELPVKKKANPRRIEQRTVLLIRNGDLVAIRKRPSRGLLAGLYEYPSLPGYLSEEQICAHLRAVGLVPLQTRRLADSRHVFSHVEWHMICYQVQTKMQPSLSAEQIARAKKEQLLFVDSAVRKEKYALPSAFSAWKTV